MSNEDRELVAGTVAHYEDPVYYEKTYRSRTEDVAFYVDLASRHERVLEYGCGNGRIVLPTARGGTPVVGVDLSRPMLDDLRARLRDETADVRARVSLRRGDMRNLRLRERFSLVTCPFNAFLHLYTREDVERFLARVREHLAPRGKFVFDVSIPDAEELARKPERLYRTAPFQYPGVGRVRYGERFDYDVLRQVLFVTMEFEPEKGEGFVTPLAHRQFYPQELEALLHYAGFEIESMNGDFGGPLENESRTLVLVTRVRASRRGRR